MVEDTAKEKTMATRRKIAPCLWFDGNAEDAVAFYVTLFPDAEVTQVSHYGDGMSFPAGTALLVEFTLFGQRFQALNGGPEFQFSEAISLSIDCKDMAEVNHYWNALTADGGQESQCGWCKDKFGVSWQVVPAGLGTLLSDPDEGRRARAVQAMMTMKKLDLDVMRRAADGQD
jgi:predicted 3-demethylubiquinone-9 3-methyltransferase (glyoxalase superfamily)